MNRPRDRAGGAASSGPVAARQAIPQRMAIARRPLPTGLHDAVVWAEEAAVRGIDFPGGQGGEFGQTPVGVSAALEARTRSTAVRPEGSGRLPCRSRPRGLPSTPWGAKPDQKICRKPSAIVHSVPVASGSAAHVRQAFTSSPRSRPLTCLSAPTARYWTAGSGSSSARARAGIAS